MTQEPIPPSDAAAAFEQLRREVALLHAAVEGFASRQQAIEARDHSADLAELLARQSEMLQRIGVLEKAPALRMTPSSIARDIEQASTTVRTKDAALLAQSKGALDTATTALQAMLAIARTAIEQRDALIWSAVLSAGATLVLIATALIVRAS